MKSSALFLGALGVSGLTGCATAPPGKPNFVFILVDDLGWADLPCYGNRFHETPHIDRLAKEGMRFTDAYAACPVCSPTRASIYSGQYPARIGLTDFIPGHWRPFEKVLAPKNDTQHLPFECLTIAEVLKSAGYTTAAFGKWHCGHGRAHQPDRHGFDKFVSMWGFRHFGNFSYPDQDLGEDDYFTEVITEQSLNFLASHKDEPFLLFVNHFAVHIPLQAREERIEKYRHQSAPESGVNHPVYAAMLEHVDHGVGRILARLKALDLEKDTLVVFYSDNGGLKQMYTKKGDVVTTNAPLRDEKGTLYEGGIRVPLIIRWPGQIRSGFTCTEPVTSVDFYPTFLELAGLDADPNHALDGLSLVPLLKRRRDFHRDAIFWHYPHYHHAAPAGAIRSGRWKLIVLYEDHRVELYDLKEDIGETRNVAADHPETVEKMRRMLANWRHSVGAKMPIPNPDYDPERADAWGVHPDRDEVLKALQAFRTQER